MSFPAGPGYFPLRIPSRPGPNDRFDPHRFSARRFHAYRFRIRPRSAGQTGGLLLRAQNRL